MRINLKPIIIILMILLSYSFVDWNFNLAVESTDNELDNTFDSRSNNLPRDGAFDWGDIEVVSEPITNQNNNDGHSNYPEFAFENELIYVVWEDNTDYDGAGFDNDIFFRFYNGNVWSEIQVISEPISGQNLNIEDSRRPAIAVENGKIYVVWQDANNTNGASNVETDIFYRCNLTGNGWEETQVISEPVSGSNLNDRGSSNVKIDIENGKISVVWRDESDINNAGEDDDIFIRSNLTGAYWEDIQVASEPISGKDFNVLKSDYPDIVICNNKIYLTWQDTNNTNGAGIDTDISFRCNLTGNGWENIQVISEPVSGKDFNVGGSGPPNIEVENDKIFIVWWDSNNTNNSGEDYDIFFKCNITGIGWEDIQVISEPQFGFDNNVGDSFYPNVLVENGKIYIVWSDTNNTDNSGTDHDIYYRCNITGYNWEDIIIISEPIKNNNFNTGGSFYPKIAINLGKNHIVWMDENNTKGSGFDNDIFYLNFSSPLILGLPNIMPNNGNSSTNFNFSIRYFHSNNLAPMKISVNISNKEYSLIETDTSDINYLDGKDYFYVVNKLNIGRHEHYFQATDGKFKWDTKIINLPIVNNIPPIITNEDDVSIFEDNYYEIDYEYKDIDEENIDQTVVWEFNTNASWLNFNFANGVLNGTPNNKDVGKYWINITINDTLEIDYSNFTLAVANINDAPVIITNNNEIIDEDEYYEVSYGAIDVDTPQSDLVWIMNSNASWLDFNHSTTLLNGTPSNEDLGTYWVNVSVSDNEYIDFTNFTLAVIGVNDGPEIITENIVIATEDVYYEVDYEAIDVDNDIDELIWNIDTNAKWMTYNTSTAIIYGTPRNDDVGKYWIYISVSDNEFIDDVNATLTVLNSNDPPEIMTDDLKIIAVGKQYSVNYEAIDIDPTNDAIKWSLKTNASTWLTIDAVTGLLMGIPTVNDIGFYWVNVTVNDGENGWDFHNFTLQISQEPEFGDENFRLSNPKMIPSGGDTETEFTFSIHYFNSEYKGPTSIQLIIDGKNYNMTLKSGENASNGTYEFGIKLSEGIHTYHFSASNETKTIKTDYFLTPNIEKAKGSSKEETSWYWLIWIVIIVIVIISIVFLLVYKKYKAKKIPTYRAELIHTPPEHLTLPSAAGKEAASTLPSPVIVAEQFPAPTKSAPTLAPSPTKPMLQLPQATLSNAQKLNLLQERFLRGEVSEKMYSKMRTEIEGDKIEDSEVIEDTNDENESSDLQTPSNSEQTSEVISKEEPSHSEETTKSETPRTEEIEPAQDEVQESTVEQSPEPQPQPVPKVKTQPTIKEEDM